MTKISFLALTLAATSLGGCALPVVIGAGAAAGYVGLQDRPVRQTADDSKLKILIKDNLAHANLQYLGDVGIDVFYGDVLITGIVPQQAEADQIIDLARRTPGVKRIYNELFVGAQYTAAQKARDAWISTQIQPRLIGTNTTFPLNYLITTVNNHVYIMGSAGSETEHRHAIHLLRTTPGVAQVHDYLVITGQTDPEKPTVPVNKVDTVTRQDAAPDIRTEDLLAH